MPNLMQRSLNKFMVYEASFPHNFKKNGKYGGNLTSYP